MNQIVFKKYGDIEKRILLAAKAFVGYGDDGPILLLVQNKLKN